MAAKKLIIACYDVATALVVACVFACALPACAWAYVDPSVMTYTIQAVAGVAVALSTVIGVAMRRGRKSLYKLLDIDEDRKREFEPDVHRTGPAALMAAQEAAPVPIAADVDSLAERGKAPVAAAADAEPLAERDAAPVAVAAEAEEQGTAPEVAAAAEAEEQNVAPDDGASAAREPSKKRLRGIFDGRPFAPKWRQRILYALVISAFTVFTIFAFSPFEVVGGAVGDLVFGVGDVWWVLLLPALGITLAWAALISIFRGKGFALMAAFTFAVGLCAYVQALCLNGGLPLANGDTIYWDDYMPMHIVSSLVWIALIVGAFAFTLYNFKRGIGVFAVVAAFLFAVQLVGSASLFFATPEPAGGAGGGGDALNTDLAHRTEVVMTEDQMYTVSPKSNVVVFILDTYDNAYLNVAEEKYPEETKSNLDKFTGFTYFKNATSAMIPTRFAIPFMLTGEMPTPDEPFSTYKAQRYPRSTFLKEIHDLNYSIGLYSDSLTIGSLPAEEQRAVTDLTVNMHKLSNNTMDFGGTLSSLYQMGLYRDSPWPLKWAFWYYTDSINSAIVKYDPMAPPEETIYVMDDIRYYNRLCEIGLSLTDENDGYDGAFRFIHLLGSHYPFNYDAEVNDLGTDGSSVIPQSIGALHIVGEYIEQLKDLGVYDETTIIVTADHGYWTITLDPIEETSTPIMFVKPAQSEAADALPYVDSMVPVSHLDLQSTILEAMGADKSEWQAYGYSMLSPEEIEPDRVRLYLTTDSEPDLTDVRLREYAIDGDAQNWNNWYETGKIWSTQE